MKGLGGLDIDARKEAGARLNQIKRRLADAVGARRAALERDALNQRLATERVDVTLPPRPQVNGTVHPISQVLDELIAILADMGFRVVEGPDIEDDFHNFTALNIPPEHPGAADARHLLLRRRRGGRAHAAPHPHLAGADPHDAGRAAAAPHHRAGSHLSLRLRHDAHAHVPPDRGTGDRREHPHGPSQGLPHRLGAGLLRGGRPAGALPPELLPLHRAVGRDGHRLLARGRGPAHRPRRRLDGDPGLRHGAPEGAGDRGPRSRALPGLRLRPGRRAPGHAQVRHPRICAASSTPTCAGCATTASRPSTCRAWLRG